MSQIIFKNESYFVIGLCMDIHNELGKGFSEAVYSEALEIELKENGVPYQKEVKFEIVYKEKTLKHHYYADFLVDNKIILELKAVEKLNSSHVKQTLNYLAASKIQLGIIINFGEDSLSYKRVLL
ncbi:GxxExxY protein [Flagellimonas meishanensis]|uniref:GxxExxY protein n=1 Tax=Flagellimonas meishanensis TaxID=2873264 RepID=UPI001CA6E74F|nr:GxxExxY protein [[Muricauda] meishanensis]